MSILVSLYQITETSRFLIIITIIFIDSTLGTMLVRLLSHEDKVRVGTMLVRLSSCECKVGGLIKDISRWLFFFKSYRLVKEKVQNF